MDELKSCPFCGGKAQFEQTRVSTEPCTVVLFYQIRCKDCGASAPKADGYLTCNLSKNGTVNVCHDDRQLAIGAWNRRPKDE